MPKMRESLYTMGGMDFTYVERCSVAGTVKLFHMAILGDNREADIYVVMDITEETLDLFKKQVVDHHTIWITAASYALYNADDDLTGPPLSYDQVAKYCPKPGVYLLKK